MFTVDDVDRQLICELHENGRQSYVELAEKLNVVEGTIRKRIKNLVDRDIVKIIAVPNLRELGYGFIAIMGLKVNMPYLRRVTDSLSRNEHVCYLAFVAGRYDVMAIVATRTPQELSHFIEKEVSAIPGILRTETFVNLDVVKGSAGLLETIQLILRPQSSSPAVNPGKKGRTTP